MAWFKRWRNKMRNYTSSGDYPGSYGGDPAVRRRSPRPASDRTSTEFGTPRGPRADGDGATVWTQASLRHSAAAITAISMRHSGRASAGR